MKHQNTATSQGDVIGIGIHAVSMQAAVAQISEWTNSRESRAVFLCNAHSLAHGRTHRKFRDALESGDLRLPDGAPVAYMLRRAGFKNQSRVCGPDLMLKYFKSAADRGETVFLYGSTPSTLAKLKERCSKEFPGLKVHSYSPPFRALSEDEDEEVVRMITASGAQTVWVALGCPKQEQWIAEHRDRIHSVLLGVGAAFAFHAGDSARAPSWMQQFGLEWLHRLMSDPRRMWKRYLVTNTQFLLFAALSAVRIR